NPWDAVDVGFVERFPVTLTLPQLKAQPALSQMPLVKKGSRLSVMPVTETEWQAVLSLR
ncbi:MAG: EVE domain-containing protein, partial [Pseudomonas sp.]|nr:EVE domain-containing protein [Pseudomonas sp.]